MDFIELARSRYSCKSFDSRQISKEQLDSILEAGRLAFPVHLRYILQHLILRIQRVADQIKVCFISTHFFSFCQKQIPIIYHNKNSAAVKRLS